MDGAAGEGAAEASVAVKGKTTTTTYEYTFTGVYGMEGEAHSEGVVGGAGGM